MKTDADLQQDVMAELKWDDSLDASRIGVTANQGVVTLSGQVDSFVEKWQAEASAQRVFGVRGLAVEIDVMLPGPSSRADADIARSAGNVLEWTSSVPHDHVKVMVEKGWLTLSGTVTFEFQRRAAADAVRSLWGVTGLTNQLGLSQPEFPIALQSQIEASVRRRVAEGGEVTVHVDGPDVTLTGTVHSWRERESVTQSAWHTPGVRSVSDKICVV
jgi:osmotically-inducible protein OsmY